MIDVLPVRVGISALLVTRYRGTKRNLWASHFLINMTIIAIANIVLLC